jgi:uncharacterized membrane protein
MRSSFLKEHSSLVGAVLLVVFILLFAFVCGGAMTSLYENGQARRRQDMASVNQAIWNSANGLVLQASILYEGFRDHLDPVLIAYSLNYRFGGTFKSLLYVHSLLIGVGAIPLYLMARRRDLGVAEALAIGMLYFLLPPMGQMIRTNYIRPDLLFFPVFTFMAYAVVFFKSRWLLVCAVPALCCKESRALIVMGLGAYLLAVERKVWMGLVYFIVGALWVPMVVYLFLLYVIDFVPKHLSRFKMVGLETLKGLYGLHWPVVLAAVGAADGAWRFYMRICFGEHSVGVLGQSGAQRTYCDGWAAHVTYYAGGKRLQRIAIAGAFIDAAGALRV